MPHPTELGRYRIVGIIGRGGMGVVYDAHDPQIDRAVAIKTIALDALSDHERAMFESRFRAEMRSTGRLQHQNIAALYDTGRDGGTAYIVMERVDGEDLKRRLAAGQQFTVAQAIDIGVQLLSALEFAHRHQVIHRDVKPANVMLQSDGTVKLCDFGVARLADSDATRTQGMIVGSLRYASPEQISGQPIDERTDVFSAGVTLFELLTGQLPFQGQSDVEVLHRIAHEPAPPLRSFSSAVPHEVDAAVRRALSKDPQDRYASAAEFARALAGSSLSGLETLPSPGLPGLRPVPAGATAPRTPTAPSVPTAAQTPADAGRSRRGALAATVGVAALVLGAGAWWGTRPAEPAKPAAGPTAGGPKPTVRAPAPPPAASAAAPVTAEAPAPPPPAAAAPTPSPAPSPAPAPAPAAPPPAPARTAAAVRVPEGAWNGQLACGASLTPGNTGPAAQPFRNDVALEVRGQRLTWTRGGSAFAEQVAGTFDAEGRFSAEGQGALKDGSSDWRTRGRGEYSAKSGRIEAQVQLMRPRDGFVTRECTLSAGRGEAVARPAPAPKPPAVEVPSRSWKGQLACGALQNSPKSNRQEPFTAKVEVKTAGTRFEWVRESPTAKEVVTGTFDAAGRFTASGEGHYKEENRGPWRVEASGAYDRAGPLIEARARLFRLSDGKLTRECTLQARP